jgi:hypothetical protein
VGDSPPDLQETALSRNRVALAAVLVIALALPASADATFRQFRSPSGNIACAYSSSGGPGPFIRCDVLSLNDVGFFLKRRGKARRHHVTDTVANPNARVLRYGHTRRFGRYTCKSRRSGLTCKNRRNGHGFKLSRERQRVF